MDRASGPRRRGRRSAYRDGPHPVDVHIGSRIRTRRTLMGLSQTDLGNGLGVTFQQVQKYERGTNRISASRLYQISQILKVPVMYFFEQLPAETAGAVSNDLPSAPHFSAAANASDAMAKRETLRFVRAYYRIADPRQRKSLNSLIRALGNLDDD